MKSKIELTRFIWVTLLIALVAVSIVTRMRLIAIPVELGLMVGGLIATGFIWYGNGDEKVAAEQQTSADPEKQKRDRIDEALRRLSDEELIELRQQLKDGEVSYDELYREFVGEEGELIHG